MSLGSENYAGKLTKSEEDHIRTLNRPEDIAKYLHDLEIEAGLRVRDDFNESVLHEIQRPIVPQASQASLKIDGVVFTGSDAELNEQLRAHFQRQQPHPQDDQPARDANGRFVSAADQGKKDEANALAAADRAMLDLQFKRGEIDAATFLEKSGAMQEYLQKQGVDLDALRDVSAGKTFEKNWATATDEFMRGHGASWPGGEELKNAVALKIAELGLVDEPSAANLTKAWNAVKEDAERIARLRDAKSPAEIEEILGTSARKLAALRGGQVWGSR
jgi:hypothetical protein